MTLLKGTPWSQCQACEWPVLGIQHDSIAACPHCGVVGRLVEIDEHKAYDFMVGALRAVTAREQGEWKDARRSPPKRKHQVLVTTGPHFKLAMYDPETRRWLATNGGYVLNNVRFWKQVGPWPKEEPLALEKAIPQVSKARMQMDLTRQGGGRR